MSPVLLGWIAVALYFAVTAGLALRGARGSGSLAGYAIGGRSLPATVVGLSLAAQLTSVATFVINPGLVHAFGLSALLGYGVAAALGITLGLLLLAPRFREQGARVQALTVPQWIGARYGSPGMRAAFAVLSLGLVAFATLIVVALALVLGHLLGQPPALVAFALVLVAVGGVIVGGATGHAWTNAVQASIMVVVALLLIGKGLPLLGGEPGLLARLAAIDPNLARPVNPASPYFRSVFEVFFCNFLVGLAIVCQPHILGKALYLRESRDMRRFLGAAIGCGIAFSSVLLTGFWARLALEQALPIDRVIPAWIASSFSPALQVLVSVGMLCAGLSTLEGILLALSAILSVDVYPLLRREGAEGGTPLRSRRARAPRGRRGGARPLAARAPDRRLGRDLRSVRRLSPLHGRLPPARLRYVRAAGRPRPRGPRRRRLGGRLPAHRAPAPRPVREQPGLPRHGRDRGRLERGRRGPAARPPPRVHFLSPAPSCRGPAAGWR
ncbi:MAG: sodium:solute symporter [Thermoanaerobaculia bacterium]|nr:sodium:solute symporter [Thermoanaerobaculia bacterium]